MIPEIILKEEKEHHYKRLSVIGFISVLIGFATASVLFPDQRSILTVVFASIPLIYPLMKFFTDKNIDKDSYTNEVFVYSSLFAGQALSFLLLGLIYPESFDLQLEILSAAGYATNPLDSFMAIFSNNIFVYFAIIGVSSLIGSSGALILTWNASVLGVFFSHLVSNMPLSAEAIFACTEESLVQLGMENPSPLCFLPHATLEMAGFIVAGITGTMISLSVYRKDFRKDNLRRILLSLIGGMILIFVAAMLESF